MNQISLCNLNKRNTRRLSLHFDTPSRRNYFHSVCFECYDYSGYKCTTVIIINLSILLLGFFFHSAFLFLRELMNSWFNDHVENFCPCFLGTIGFSKPWTSFTCKNQSLLIYLLWLNTFLFSVNKLKGKFLIFSRILQKPICIIILFSWIKFLAFLSRFFVYITERNIVAWTGTYLRTTGPR